MLTADCCHRFLGDRSEEDPPVPIPNTEVKLLSPDGTAQATVWESRTSPGLNPTKGPLVPPEGFLRFPSVHSPTLPDPPLLFAEFPPCYIQIAFDSFRESG